MQEIANQIRGLIAKSKLEQALDQLIQWCTTNNDSDHLNTFILLKANVEKIKQQERLGILNFSDSLSQRALISNSILDILKDAETSLVVPQDPHKPTQNTATKTKKILFLASSPADLARLKLEKEFVRLSSSLQDGIVEYKLVAEWAVTPSSLQKAILKHKPNIIHFSGHGEENQGIYLQDSQANAKLVSQAAIENLFRIFARKLSIDIVLLNSCYSEDQAVGIRKHVNYVIGMKDAINDDSAIEFSTGFYRGLVDEDNDIEFAFDLAVNLIQLEGLYDEEIPVLLKKEEG